MGWTFFWMMVVLKVPVVLALWLVWYAVREPAPPEREARDDGGSRHGPRHPRGRPPSPPRRGPHSEPPPPAPARVRAGGRTPTRTPG